LLQKKNPLLVQGKFIMKALTYFLSNVSIGVGRLSFSGIGWFFSDNRILIGFQRIGFVWYGYLSKKKKLTDTGFCWFFSELDFLQKLTGRFGFQGLGWID
jgi:hypothetical protein